MGALVFLGSNSYAKRNKPIMCGRRKTIECWCLTTQCLGYFAQPILFASTSRGDSLKQWRMLHTSCVEKNH